MKRQKPDFNNPGVYQTMLGAGLHGGGMPATFTEGVGRVFSEFGAMPKGGQAIGPDKGEVAIGLKRIEEDEARKKAKKKRRMAAAADLANL